MSVFVVCFVLCMRSLVSSTTKKKSLQISQINKTNTRHVCTYFKAFLMVIQKIFIKVQTFVTFVTILWHFWLVVCSCHLLMPAAWKVLRQSDINMEWGKYQNWNGFRNWTNQCQWCIAGYVNGWRLCLIRPLCFEHRTTQDSTQIGKLCICSYCSTKYPCYLFVSSVTKVCKCYKTFLSVRPFWPEWQPIRFTVTVRDPFDLNGWRI